MGDAFLRKRHNYHMICLLEHFLYVQWVSNLFFWFLETVSHYAVEIQTDRNPISSLPMLGVEV